MILPQIFHNVSMYYTDFVLLGNGMERNVHKSHASEFSHLLQHLFDCRVHSPTNALLYFKKHIKISIKIRINIAPTCFGLRPSSGSMH